MSQWTVERLGQAGIAGAASTRGIWRLRDDEGSSLGERWKWQTKWRGLSWDRGSSAIETAKVRLCGEQFHSSQKVSSITVGQHCFPRILFATDFADIFAFILDLSAYTKLANRALNMRLEG
ncbi:Hypothetical protein NTJ_08968 [Nesidiocoris tenuis]|uniref:Uncharacterized protein n=1 Tax=Nesidiocoris tenuis TaxID=355587 RepID=A0ABN7AW35_9HEMI|nr:Hypothetical protein NTJ_08968 [Nesidiocoris tenuis]